MEKTFPNGFASWQETHYEVVKAIEVEQGKDDPQGVVRERHDAQGHGGLYELAEELTDEFEKTYGGEPWDGDFFDTIDMFMRNKLFP